MTEFDASSAGLRALAALRVAQIGQIAGMTSRGTFVLYGAGRVLYVTGEPYRGPLTINLLPAREWQSRVKVGMDAHLGGDCLDIPRAGATLHVGRARPWQAPPLPAGARPPAERYAAGRDLIRRAGAARAESSLAAWLDGLAFETPLPPALLRLRAALRAHDISALVTLASDELLGRGRGLTPSGDDCVAGLLLALNRWRGVLWLGPGLAGLNAGIVAAAARRTTAVSASLIECAGQGAADERLVTAVDGLMAGAPSPAQCAAALRLYGASSGIDTLAGLVAALWAGDA